MRLGRKAPGKMIFWQDAASIRPDLIRPGLSNPDSELEALPSPEDRRQEREKLIKL